MKGFTVATLAALGTAAVAVPTKPNGNNGNAYGNSGQGNGNGNNGNGNGNGGSNAGSMSGLSDADILNYALTLEHLENTFYMQGLQNFTEAEFAAAGFDSTFYKNLMEVSSDESTHVLFLTQALQAAGAQPVAQCTYDFSAVTSPQSFVATASVLEGVGVSAYLGAAADIMSKDYLTAAGAILTVESRHSSYIRQALMQSPFPSPFDVPLDFNEVYTLAAPFIVSCPEPSSLNLGLMAFPMLALDMSSAPMPIQTGSHITISTVKDYKIPQDKHVYGAFITVTGPVFVPVTVGHECMSVSLNVPAGIAGQSYFVLTNSDKEATDDTIVAGPAIVEVTPEYMVGNAD